MICKILGQFVNTSTAPEKYSLLNKDILTKPIEMQLSTQKKYFAQFFPTYLKSRSNRKHFKKIDDPHSLCISEITDCERRN